MKKIKVTNFDFVAIENAIDALRYSFTFDFAKNEIHKKYHRDIFFNLVNSQLNYDDTTEAAKMLNLKEMRLIIELYHFILFQKIKRKSILWNN